MFKAARDRVKVASNVEPRKFLEMRRKKYRSWLIEI